MNGTSGRIWPYAALVFLVVVAAGATGLIFGGLAAIPHGDLFPKEEIPRREKGDWEDRVVWTGLIVGTAAGIASGLAWSRTMIRKARKEPAACLVRPGSILGAKLGAGSTVVLHVFLTAVRQAFHPQPAYLFIGLGIVLPLSVVLFGITAGAAVGANAGWALEFVRRLANRAVASRPVQAEAP
jgi:hypothetical protein